MIGEASDCPVRIYVLMGVKGDGRIVHRRYVSGIFASLEAARAKRESYRGWGPYYINEYELNDEGRYEMVAERV